MSQLKGMPGRVCGKPTLAATKNLRFEEATALCGGVSRSLLTIRRLICFFAEGAGGGFPKRWLNIFKVTSGADGPGNGRY